MSNFLLTFLPLTFVLRTTHTITSHQATLCHYLVWSLPRPPLVPCPQISESHLSHPLSVCSSIPFPSYKFRVKEFVKKDEITLLVRERSCHIVKLPLRFNPKGAFYTVV